MTAPEDLVQSSTQKSLSFELDCSLVESGLMQENGPQQPIIFDSNNKRQKCDLNTNFQKYSLISNDENKRSNFIQDEDVSMD